MHDATRIVLPGAEEATTPMSERLGELRQKVGARGGESDRSDNGDGGRSGQSKRSPGGTPVKSSHVIEEHIDVGVPRQVAYDQWTRYRDLSKYSKHEEAKPKRNDRITFSSKIGPSSRQWDANVVQQVPPKRIAWRSKGGAENMGVVTFHELDDRLTRVMVEMEYHPKGFFETLGNFLRMQRRRVRKDLKLFKHFIELRGAATGKGAGEIKGRGLVEEADERLGDGGENDEGAGAHERQAS